MNLNPDDPRLTAYALGEMPESERVAFEAALKNSTEGLLIVEEIRQTATLLETKLAAEEYSGLSFAQQRQIETRLRPTTHRPRSLAWKVWLYGGISAAAACLMAALFLASLSRSKDKEVQVTLNSPIPAAGQRQATVEPRPQPADGRQIEDTTFAPPASNDRSGGTESAMDGGQKPQNGSAVALSLESRPVTPVVDSPAPVSPRMETRTQVVQLRSADPAEVLSILQDTVGQTSRRSSTESPFRNRIQQNASDDGRRGGGGGGGFGGGGRFVGTPPNDVASVDNSGNLIVRGESTVIQQIGEVVQPLQREIGIAGEQRDFFRIGSDRSETPSYPHLIENSFLSPRNAPLSTFSIDVDTASYANVRRFLKSGRMPPRDAVRIEEMINYFTYAYPQPRREDPFAANIEVASCPWNTGHRLVRIGLKGREIKRENRPPSNFVFLIDVSGSMQPQERLPLIKAALRQLVKKMNERDRVALVVYASQAGLKLESTSCAEKEKILQAIDELDAGGSTNGGDGIRQAYRIAEQNFIKEGVNRVLLCTDGDFNVGTTDQNELVRMIQQKAKSGVFLTTLGVGTDNYKDALMQNLADKGNGNYHYLDTLEEAQKVLIDQMNGTLVTIAKDVKIQIEFNPAQVGAYRLIGYEKRLLRKEDFNNDAKDAGEIGAGHTVTALYEIVPSGRDVPSAVDDLKYQQAVPERPERYVTTDSKELLTLKLRYKQPDGDQSRLLEFPITDSGKRFNNASGDFQFAAAVASFGMLLRDSEFKGSSSYGAVLELAEAAKGSDEEGYRSEFLNLVRQAQRLR